MLGGKSPRLIILLKVEGEMPKTPHNSARDTMGSRPVSTASSTANPSTRDDPLNSLKVLARAMSAPPAERHFVQPEGH